LDIKVKSTTSERNYGEEHVTKLRRRSPLVSASPNRPGDFTGNEIRTIGNNASRRSHRLGNGYSHNPRLELPNSLNWPIHRPRIHYTEVGCIC